MGPNDPPGWRAILAAAALLATPPPAPAQAQAPQEPQVGYVYPAGVQRGTTRVITVGGQHLDGTAAVLVSGPGVRAVVLHHTKLPTRKQINTVRRRLREMRARGQGEEAGDEPGSVTAEDMAEIEEKTGMSMEELLELRKKLRDPKRQPNPQISETVTLQITIDSDATPGQRELRVRTPRGLSNPIYFHVGRYDEHDEREPNDDRPDPGMGSRLPVVLNGQILPGDVDRFRFEASAGDRLVVAARARELIPFLADAVPGWFQATLTLSDERGLELAFTDDYRFHPDPVLYCEIPQDGAYTLEIRDALYRGREDFVYRITIGELPRLTSVFPLGGPAGSRTEVEVAGWNLPTERMELDWTDAGPGIRPITVPGGEGATHSLPFDLDTLPECLEVEPNDDGPSAHRLALPMIVNGRIEERGDVDVFRFRGRRGQEIVAEVRARRLGSPLDSLLLLTDEGGREIASNDDDPGAGADLTTHHADSVVQVTLPATGVYHVLLRDAQNGGGPAHGYRLRISEPRPDFALRVVPSGINVRAGTTTAITVHALRKDGFDGGIALSLRNAPPGFLLSGAWIPEGRDEIRLTLSAPGDATEQPVLLHLEGRATIVGRGVRRAAAAADDRVQAFVNHHLVTSEHLLVTVTENRRTRLSVKIMGEMPVRLPLGGTARVYLRAPRRLRKAELQLQLDDPPDGITVGDLTFDRDRASFTLATDGEKVEPGQRGNLIVEVYAEREVKSRNGKPSGKRRRVLLGTLPAVPFETVEP